MTNITTVEEEVTSITLVVEALMKMHAEEKDNITRSVHSETNITAKRSY